MSKPTTRKYAKRRETTYGYAEGVDGINTTKTGSRFARLRLSGPGIGLRRVDDRARWGQLARLGGGHRIENERDIAAPSIACGIHRRQDAVEHGDDPRQVLRDDVRIDESGLLRAAGEFLESLVKRRRKVITEGSQPPRRGQDVVFSRSQRDRCLQQVGDAAHGIVVLAGLFDRGREFGGDAVERGSK